nr:hypothetical protein [Tanacetum cinerariifolium]
MACLVSSASSPEPTVNGGKRRSTVSNHRRTTGQPPRDHRSTIVDRQSRMIKTMVWQGQVRLNLDKRENVIERHSKITIFALFSILCTWHNGTSTKTISTKTSDGLAVIQAQLNNLEREIKKVNEKVYAAQVECELCKGTHYTKDCPLKE